MVVHRYINPGMQVIMAKLVNVLGVNNVKVPVHNTYQLLNICMK